MSAFLVGEDHVNYLINAALAFNRGGHMHWYSLDGEARKLGELRTGDEANCIEVGAMLWRENCASINARYGETKEAPDFRFKLTSWARVTPVQVLKAIRCYEYQSCEHRGWHASSAHAFCEALRQSAISRLAGYSEAAWEVRP